MAGYLSGRSRRSCLYARPPKPATLEGKGVTSVDGAFAPVDGDVTMSAAIGQERSLGFNTESGRSHRLR